MIFFPSCINTIFDSVYKIWVVDKKKKKTEKTKQQTKLLLRIKSTFTPFCHSWIPHITIGNCIF